ncbi:MAG: LD-carboxypeptidase [Chthonomonas sp.]|nr:LD-carboxypeptidase [Chthonomonas sp.]
MAIGVAATLGAPSLSKASLTGTKAIRPPRLKPGDTVGIVSPAGFTSDPLDIDIVRENLGKLGLKIKVGQNALERYGPLAGTDQQRADDFNRMVNDPSVQGICCLRGGYGTTRILHLVDYASFRAHPKVVWGFSDITGLLNALTKKTGVITFHAPTAASNWGEYDLASMKSIILEADYGTALPDYVGDPVPEAVTLIPGTAQGRLVGGNLSLLSAVGGSQFAPDTEGAMVFIEEVGEEPYRVDRMLTQLLLAGAFKRAKGIIFGGMRLRSNQAPSADPKDWTMLDVLRDRALAIGLPAFTGFPAGHIADQVVMPIGVRVEMDAVTRTLRLLEPAVS